MPPGPVRNRGREHCEDNKRTRSHCGGLTVCQSRAGRAAVRHVHWRVTQHIAQTLHPVDDHGGGVTSAALQFGVIATVQKSRQLQAPAFTGFPEVQ